MTTLSPARKRIAMLIVVVGSALLGERVVALATAEAEISTPVQARRARPNDTGKSATADLADARGSAGSVQLERLDTRQRGDTSNAMPVSQPLLFDTVSWLPPPPKLVAPPPPAKPVPPPFPYVHIGGMSDDGVRTVFFTQGDRVIPVRAGDTIDSIYRVDQMTDKQMTLTYLPLGETLTVALGSGR